MQEVLDSLSLPRDNVRRQVRRLLAKLKRQGDRAVIHGLRGRPSNRRLSKATRERVTEILKQPLYRDYGPTLASEHFARRYKIRIGREALRQLMSSAGLWRPKRRKAEEPAKAAKHAAKGRRRTPWMDHFDLHKSMPVWRAARAPEAPQRGESL